jgi:hypothetical protein
MIKKKSEQQGRSMPRAIKRKLAFVGGVSKRPSVAEKEKDITNRFDKMAVDDSSK